MIERAATSSDLPDPRTAMALAFMRAVPSRASMSLADAAPGELADLFVAGGLEAKILGRLLPDQIAQLLGHLDENHARSLLTELNPSRSAIALSRLSAAERQRTLALLDPGAAREIAELLAFPSDTAGGLMDPDVSALREEATVADALEHLRRLGREIQDVYLVDDEGRLRGAIPVQRIAISRPEDPLMSLTREKTPSVLAMTSREEVVEMFAAMPLPSLPVVNYEERLLGVLRHRTIVGAAEEEASADIQKMMGASSEERALSPAMFAVKKRLPWLLINLLTAAAAAAVVGIFEGLLAQVTALAVMLPVVAGQSGNTGSQALAVTMRGLALREVRPSHWRRLATKEMLAGFVNGIAVAIVCAIGVLLWAKSADIAQADRLAVVLFVSMILSMVMAGLSGASVPIVLKKLGQDPATASSIILTTVTDIVGFFSFLGIAGLLLAR